MFPSRIRTCDGVALLLVLLFLGRFSLFLGIELRFFSLLSFSLVLTSALVTHLLVLRNRKNWNLNEKLSCRVAPEHSQRKGLFLRVPR